MKLNSLSLPLCACILSACGLAPESAIPSGDGLAPPPASGLELLLPEELDPPLGSFNPRAFGAQDEESSVGEVSLEAEEVIEDEEFDGVVFNETIGLGAGAGGRLAQRGTGASRLLGGSATPAPASPGPASPGPDSYAGPGDSIAPTEMSRSGGVAFNVSEESKDPVLRDAEITFEHDLRSEGGEQPDPWQRTHALANATRLRVGDDEELPLLGLQLSVWVEGARARVVMDCMYMNDHERQLEGDFRLRLPEGASPYYFAFGGSERRAQLAPNVPLFEDDVELRRTWSGEPGRIASDRAALWSEPKEARMVERERAAFAYGETVRRQVDPALLEWSGAGIFNARVYPLMPGSQARVVVGYELDLARTPDGFEFVVDLPADVPELAVDLFVLEPEGARVTVAPGVDPWREGARTHWSWTRPEERRFSVSVEGLGPVALASPASVDEDWFAVRLNPELERAEELVGPGAAVLALDTSLSAREDFARWAELAPLLLEANRDSISSFAVLFFDVEQRWWRPAFTPNTQVAVAELARELQSLWLEGATDLEAALSEVARPRWQAELSGREWDVFLFSDGVASWGEADRRALSEAVTGGGAGRIFAYSASAVASPEALVHVARESGGAVFGVSPGPGALESVAVAHRQAPWVLEEVRLAGARDLLLAGRPRSLYPGQELRLVGRGRPRPGASVELALTRGGDRRNLSMQLEAVLESELAARAYGEVAVAQLEELGTALEAESAPFARHFRVPGSSCSLLMLESAEDYERFGIEEENDALVVRGNEVGALLERALREQGAQLSDPKLGLLAWVGRLSEAPGITWEAPEGLFENLEALDSELFRVPRTALLTSTRGGSDLNAELRAGLLAGEPPYDALEAAALARLESAGPAGALRLFSSLVELSPGDGVVARDVGFAALSWGLSDHAYHLFRRVSVARPFEPQSYHAMARCLEDIGQVDLAMVWYEVALAGRWEGRVGDFERICGLDYLRLLRRIEAGEAEASLHSWAGERLPALRAEYEPARADVLVTITWNTDRTDVDLHVQDPGGEVCYYGHRETAIGGRLTQDVTEGYGPEMFVLENAVNGDYRILAHYFSGDPSRSKVRTKVYARVYLDWGGPEEEVRDVVVPLVETGEFRDVAVLRCNKL